MRVCQLVHDLSTLTDWFLVLFCSRSAGTVLDEGLERWCISAGTLRCSHQYVVLLQINPSAKKLTMLGRLAWRGQRGTSVGFSGFVLLVQEAEA